MADVTYRDKNRAGWLIIESNGRFFGTPDPASKVHYDPQPPDTDVVATEAAAAAAIEVFALANRRSLVLDVNASGDVGLIVLLLAIGLLVLSESKGKR